MGTVSAFQLAKHGERSNEIDRLHNTPIVSYGRIIEVIDIHTVIVEAAVKTSLNVETYIVPLLSLSSDLLELNIYPKVGDRVLLLFLQKYDADMFDAEEAIENPYATGYNSSSVVGILLTTFKGFASTLIKFSEDDKKPIIDITSDAKWQAILNSSVGLMFCRAVFNSEDEQIISILFGEGRPLIEKFLSKVTKEYGFWKDQNDNQIELDAPVVERYSRYAPITKDVQGSQTVTIGIDDEGNDTDAPVKITLGKNADITVESGSGKTEKYDGDVSLESDKNVTVKATKIELKNTSESLGGLLGEFIDKVLSTINSTVVVAPPGTAGGNCTVQVVPAELMALKTRLQSLLK